jgi:hypothetical protein
MNFTRNSGRPLRNEPKLLRHLYPAIVAQQMGIDISSFDTFKYSVADTSLRAER